MQKITPARQRKNREKKIKAANVINTLSPYRDPKTRSWFYDDVELGVHKEAFVLGSSEVIDALVGEDCDSFTMHISSKPIPKADAHLVNIDHIMKLRGAKNEDFNDVIDVEASGSEVRGWYQLMGTDMEHWLCGCVLDYFEDYPANIYVKIQR